MSNSPFLIIHITAGLIGIISGFSAMVPRKGSPLHLKIGNVFFYSMMAMTLSAIYLAINQPSQLNAMVGLFTFYMVVTAQRTAKNLRGKSGLFEIAAFFYVLSVFIFGIFISISVTETGTKADGIPAEAYYFFTIMSGICMLIDLIMIFRGGVYGKKRVARHLWRMCFALFVATSSFFLGQPQVFPEAIRGSLILVFPVLLVIISLFFWLIKVLLFTKKRYV